MFTISGPSRRVLSGRASGPRGVILSSFYQWGGDAAPITDSAAIDNHAWRVENGESNSFTLAVVGKKYQVFVRYRFEGSSPGNADLHFDQAGRQSLVISAVTPASTYDGPATKDGQAGYYDLGQMTLVDGALTVVVDGPSTVSDAVIVDQIILEPVPVLGIGTMVINSTFVVGGA